jgi:hypothetical protein
MFKQPEWDYAATVKKLVDQVGMSLGQAEIIVRTESTAVANKARELAYQEREEESGETYVFKWVGPDDNRTTKTCKEIVATINREGGAVPLKRLKQIIHDVSKKDNPDLKPRDYVAHIGCRHRLLRVVE